MNLSNTFGFWKEFYSNTFPRPSIFNDIKNVLIQEDKDKILDYLKSGLMLVASRQVISCPIYKERIGSNEVFTDGLWFWTIEAIYYVEKHDVAIPISFVDHIKKNGFIFPQIDKNDYDLIDPLCDRAAELS